MKLINIYPDKKRADNDRFWAGAGRADLYATAQTEAGESLLKRIAEKKSCDYVRGLFALNKKIKDGVRLGGDVYSEDKDGAPVYDFEWINKSIEAIVKNGLKPILTLGYMPEALVGTEKSDFKGIGEVEDNFALPKDYDKWYGLVKAFVTNLIDKFGLDEVRTWYFEVWNEPDNWKIENWTDFLKLYDYAAEAVKSCDTALKVGGPASFYHPFITMFAEHAATGTNYATGEKSVPLDFLSHHVYGVSDEWLKDYPLILPNVQRFIQETKRIVIGTLEWFRRFLPDKEFLLDAWELSSNYERTSAEESALEMRNSEFAGIFAVKMADCIVDFRLTYDINVTKMLYWGLGEDVSSKMFDGSAALVTKNGIYRPAQTAFEFLSMLADTFVQIDGIKAGSDEGVLAAADENKVQALAYYFNDYDINKEYPDREYTLKFNNLAKGKYRLNVYTMDETHNNTYRLWQRQGAPENPSEAQLAELRREQEISADVQKEIEVVGDSFEYAINLPTMSMKLVCLEKI